MSEETESQNPPTPEDSGVTRQLIAQEADELHQMELLLGDEKLYIDYGEQPFSHTAERFFRDRPGQVAPVLKLIAAGISFRSIERRFNVSHHTLKEIAFRKSGDIAEIRKHIAEICFGGGAMAMERVIELLPDEKSAKDAAIAGGILLTKGMELSGQPTQRIEIDHKIDFHAELTHLLKEAEQKVREIKQVEGRTLELEEANV